MKNLNRNDRVIPNAKAVLLATRVISARNLWIIPVSLSLLVSFFTPVDVLTYGIPSSAVALVGTIIPMMQKLNGQYELAQVVQFYFSIMWLVSPLLYLSVLEGGYLTEKLVASYKERNFLRPFGLFIFFIASIWFCIFHGVDPTDTNDVRTNLILHSRLGLATYGFIVANGPALMFALVVHIKRHFHEIYS